MTIKNTLLLILFSASLTAYADEAIPTTPQKADAEKWLTDFRAARDKTSDALFLNDANKRSQLTPVLKELRDRAEKLFSDDFSVCTKAAEAVNGYWMSEIFLMQKPSYNPHINLSGIVTLAWQGGQAYSACYDLIAGIK